MKITIQYGRDSGTNKEEFAQALEEWALDQLGIDEELTIEISPEDETGSK